jgi:peptide/nickel transport system substrate-binding protein
MWDIPHFDPWFIGNNSRHVHYQIFDPVVLLAKTGEYEPGLAESWEYQPDGLKITLKLRQGVTFHSGAPVNVAALQANVARAKDTTIGHVLSVGAANIKDVVKIDDFTAEVSYATPQPKEVILDFFAAMFLIDPAKMADVRTAPSGTGPYKLTSFTAGQQTVMTMNDAYWQPGFPRAKELVIKPFTDPATMALNLRGGDLDWAAGLAASQVGQLKGAGINTDVQGALGGCFIIAINMKSGKLAGSDKLREGLAYAIDRDKIVKNVFFGTTLATCTPFWNSELPVYKKEDVTRFAFNLDSAKQAFAAGGGSNLKLTAVADTSIPELQQILEIVQADLASIGVTIDVQPLPTQEATNRRNALQYDIVATATSVLPRDLSYTFASVGNFRADDKIADGWIDAAYQAKAKAAAAELDPGKRNAMYGELRDTIMSVLPHVAVCSRNNYYGFRKGLTGFVDRVGDYPDLMYLGQGS